MSSFRMACFRRFSAPYRQAKKRNNEMAQTSHHISHFLFKGSFVESRLSVRILGVQTTL